IRCCACGAIKLSPRDPLPRRLSIVFNRLSEVINQHQPENVAIEDVFYAVNVKSALKLGQVRGVAMLAASSAGIEVAEYSPLSIKSAVVGYGKASKHQVQQMVARLLKLEAPPDSPDAADGLASWRCGFCPLRWSSVVGCLHQRRRLPRSHSRSISRAQFQNTTDFQLIRRGTLLTPLVAQEVAALTRTSLSIMTLRFPVRI